MNPIIWRIFWSEYCSEFLITDPSSEEEKEQEVNTDRKTSNERYLYINQNYCYR